jgi:hypothetical protein
MTHAHIFHIRKIIFGVSRTLIIKLDLPAGIRKEAYRSITAPKLSLSATALRGIYIELPCSNIENMLPFHNLQATHNLSHAQRYMKLLYIELFERSLPAWVVVRITNGMEICLLFITYKPHTT